MTEWIRFSRNNQFGFGVVEDEQVVSYKGDMLHTHEPDGEVFSLCDVTLECPVPSSAIILGIWNNFDAVREKQTCHSRNTLGISSNRLRVYWGQIGRFNTPRLIRVR